MNKRIAAASTAVGGALVAVLAAAGPAAAGVTGPAFYVDGQMYRTVGTPTDFSHTGAPAHSYNTIYALMGAPESQPNIADAKPGDRDFRGGRWMVTAVSFPSGYMAALADADTNNNHVIDSDTELGRAVDAGTAVVGDVVQQFECPVIPLPKGPKH